MIFRAYLLVPAAAMLLASCMAPSNAGRGPVTLSPSVARNYQTYRSSFAPIAFAITPDGLGSSYITCPGSVCIDHLKAIDEVVEQCSMHSGRRCYLYDVSGKVVWQTDATS